MTDGTVSGSPTKPRISRRQRISKNVSQRVAACAKLARVRVDYSSIMDFIRKQRVASHNGDWHTSKGQMVRDMRTLFGRDWAIRRGGGGRGHSGGRRNGQSAPGLVIPKNAEDLLRPCHRPTMLSPLMEKGILEGLYTFECNFGIGIVTPVLIVSLAVEEVLSALPNLNTVTDMRGMWNSTESRHTINTALERLNTVHHTGWIRSFLNRHKTRVRNVVRARALEQHKASKH